MLNAQRTAGIAAYLNAVVALGTLVVALVLIGPAALADPRKLIALALRNPMPLLAMDGLKVASALISVVLIVGLFDRLYSAAPALALAAVVFGGLSIVCLVGNAGMSLYATSQAAQLSAGRGQNLNLVIALLAIGAVMANGPWYLLVSWAAWRAGRLPSPVIYLGLGMGLLSLVPPLAVLLLMLSIVWSLGLAQALQRRPASP